MRIHNTNIIIEAISDEICNPDLDLNYISYMLKCSDKTIYKNIKVDFNITPTKLIENIRLFKILKYTHDHYHNIYKSASYYGIIKKDSFHNITKRRFNKTPLQIELEITIDNDRRLNFYKYHKEFLVDNLLL